MDAANLIQKFCIRLHHSTFNPHVILLIFSHGRKSKLFLFFLTTIHNYSLSHAPLFLLCDVIMVMSDVMSHITDSVTLSRTVTQTPGRKLSHYTCHVTRPSRVSQHSHPRVRRGAIVTCRPEKQKSSEFHFQASFRVKGTCLPISVSHCQCSVIKLSKY